ncbi:hypothetical protein CERZMDRAFT_94865 [Cercospora zeae-maydis SCOH1-5]|uniref:Uncharacterized protein n=1 Tax=Cercospora zeae-maydis SCOH1-5 TaxID=717836 RepID=A0A6A6FPQ3_9PEZI|nr:hypothetical protein CERZMDRAFT_94865 [Cercospora zeae-maydis SCOH1-5]
MSASAIASQTQYQAAFASKKQQHSKPHHESGNSSSSAAIVHNKPEFTIGKANLEDPFQFDDNKYLVNARYNNTNTNSYKPDQDVVDDESIYSTPIGQSQVAPAVDTPIPYSNQIDYHHAPAAAAREKEYNSPAKQIDDYDKIVQVIHDHITRELPPLQPKQWKQQQESQQQPLEGQGAEKASCGCGDKAAEESPAPTEEEGASGGVEEPAAAVVEEKTVAAEPEDEPKGKEAKDEGDDTSAAEEVKAEEKPEAKAEQVEQKQDEVKPDVVEKKENEVKADTVAQK